MIKTLKLAVVFIPGELIRIFSLNRKADPYLQFFQQNDISTLKINFC